MGFYKNCEGLSFFLSVHFIFILQILLVFYIDDKECKEGNIILLTHKIIFYIILFLTFYSHLKISITDPGSIDYYNNLDIIEFYYFIYRDINLINEQFKKRNIFALNQEEDEEKYNTRSDEDEKEFEYKTSINNKTKREISKTLHIKITRCYNCHVVRPKDAHHCIECHSCFLDRDHHCPWMNNCIGLFNKKYFIIFNKTFRNDIAKNIISIFWGLFAFIYGLFVVIMVIEQRDNMYKEFKKYDEDKDNKKKLIGIKMRIIFGGEFSFRWFSPFHEGGKRQLYYFIRKKKYEIHQQRLKKKEQNKNEIKNENDNIENIKKEKND